MIGGRFERNVYALVAAFCAIALVGVGVMVGLLVGALR